MLLRVFATLGKAVAHSEAPLSDRKDQDIHHTTVPPYDKFREGLFYKLQ